MSNEEGTVDIYNELDKTVPIESSIEFCDPTDFNKPSPEPKPVSKPSPKGRPRKKPAPETTEEFVTETVAKSKKSAPLKGQDKEQEKRVILEQIKKYKASPSIGPKIEDVNVSERDDLETLRSVYSSIKSRLSAQFNRHLVDMMFLQGVSASEKAMVNFINIRHMQGFTDAIESNMEEFDTELEELSLEMGKYYQPSPFMKLMSKLFIAGVGFAESKYSNLAGRKMDFEDEDSNQTDKNVDSTSSGYR